MTLDDLKEHFKYLESCCLHEPVWTPGDVTEILFAIQSDGSSSWTVGWEGGSETSVIVVVALKDGYGLLSSGEDYTGHGCQCGSFTGKYEKLSQLFKDGILPDMYN